ncbi:unnamed protein product (macronuclear) [Paramecium tetraurelia]|uniref:Transmembrane protein n=1 Tax=Paramecium tetraurelia TaxID=5888 RepID=A0BBG5_PARTE|nr:uncharacterized protein GSPATT00000317001 [Paramecium tetraurelia]CAK55882.1 unnamed protein product [Paramecium tetraurelia]|eukprot:XP_001423280.1 hypothetical protein (macronuclear) [Paramecium tetraurelia strain d4-2]
MMIQYLLGQQFKMYLSHLLVLKILIILISSKQIQNHWIHYNKTNNKLTQVILRSQIILLLKIKILNKMKIIIQLQILIKKIKTNKINLKKYYKSGQNTNRFEKYQEIEDQNQTQDMIEQSQYLQDDKTDLLYKNQSQGNDQITDYNLTQADESKNEKQQYKDQKVQNIVQVQQNDHIIDIKQVNQTPSTNLQENKQQKKKTLICKCCQIF